MKSQPPISGTWQLYRALTRPLRPSAAWLAHWRAGAPWINARLLFALVALTELFVVQQLTLTSHSELGPQFAQFAPVVRLLHDSLMIGLLVVLLGRFGLALFSISSSCLFLLLITFHQYFDRPLSVLTLMNQWHEGFSTAVMGWGVIRSGTLAIVAAVLLGKLALITRAGPADWRSRQRWIFAGLLLTFYGGVIVLTNRYDPLDRILTKRGIGRLGMIRGYTGPWLAELYYLNDDRILISALERRERKSDELSSRESIIPIEPRLVVVQLESFDFHVLGYRAAGLEVTPFLNALRECSLFYRVRAFHYQASADADFTFLTGTAAVPTINAYNLTKYPYDRASWQHLTSEFPAVRQANAGDSAPATQEFTETFPQVLSSRGYRSVALHGNWGGFYNRLEPFRKMGFDEIYFREQLEGDFNLAVDRLGVRDADLMRLSAQMLRQAKEPVCHFLITLSTHTPYQCLRSDENEIFPHPNGLAERYFNNMRYLDNCLRDYIAALPKHTTVVLYADHCTEVSTPGFSPDREGSREFIPCFIYDTSVNLGERQRTHGKAQDGSLNFLDIVTYLRNQILKLPPKSESVPSAPLPAPPADASGEAQSDRSPAKLVSP